MFIIIWHDITWYQKDIKGFSDLFLNFHYCIRLYLQAEEIVEVAQGLHLYVPVPLDILFFFVIFYELGVPGTVPYRTVIKNVDQHRSTHSVPKINSFKVEGWPRCWDAHERKKCEYCEYS